MAYIDTHCHIDFSAFSEDRRQILDKCHQLNIRKIIVPGVLEDTWGAILSLCDEYSNLAPAIGFHPCYLDNITRHSFENFKKLLESEPGIVAIGETGLDFFIQNPDRENQKKLFQMQVSIANEFHLPLILHVRKAHDETLKILKNSNFSQGGVVHCYSGSLQQAEKYLNLGLKLGIGGVITYGRSLRLQKIVSKLPLSSFVIETDAPDIPPFGKERERNSPTYLPQIFDSFSGYRWESQVEIATALINNTLEVFPKLGTSIERLS